VKREFVESIPNSIDQNNFDHLGRSLTTIRLNFIFSLLHRDVRVKYGGAVSLKQTFNISLISFLRLKHQSITKCLLWIIADEVIASQNSFFRNY
jgi:hypothetical protein